MASGIQDEVELSPEVRVAGTMNYHARAILLLYAANNKGILQEITGRDGTQYEVRVYNVTTAGIEALLGDGAKIIALNERFEFKNPDKHPRKGSIDSNVIPLILPAGSAQGRDRVYWNKVIYGGTLFLSYSGQPFPYHVTNALGSSPL